MPYSSATIGGHLIISPPLINSSSPWASSRAHLDALYDSPHTGAVTTRTSTITGFSEDNAIHTVAFHASTVSSINSYGYSPIKLDTYLEWIREIVVAHPASEKPFIVSIASALPDEMRTMFATIQSLRASLAENGNKTVIAVEVNTSCPNIKDHPPPGYNLVELGELLHVIHDVVLADTANPVPLVVGIKLPPYVHSGQFAEVVDLLATLQPVAGRNPVSFLTCTNTLGSSLLFDHQVVPSPGEGMQRDSGFALPTVFGGLAGEAIHALSLGNVHAFKQLLESHPSSLSAHLGGIKIIGVGGVTSRAAAKRMWDAGADVVGLATWYGRDGIEVFGKVWEE